MRNKKILFCFTFAGGTAAFYERLIQRIQPDVEVICFDYSGHGKRYKEKLPSDFEEVANDFYLEIYTKSFMKLGLHNKCKEITKCYKKYLVTYKYRRCYSI